MKELIYRELYLSKKGILLGSAIGLILFIGSTMVLLSARFGNLAKYNDPGELSELMSIIPTVTPAAIYCILLSGVIDGSWNLVFDDHLCGWHKYIKSSPLNPKTYVGAKYLVFMMMMIFFSALMLIICPVLYSLGNPGVFMACIRCVLLSASLVLLMDAYILPVNLYMKKREKVGLLPYLPILVIFVIIFLTALGAMIYADMDPANDERVRKAVESMVNSVSRGKLDVIIFLLPVISVMILYVSYRISLGIVEKEQF